jgi:transcription elongation factor GreB
MSKAFTRESDDSPEDPIRVRLPGSLASGGKNYLTPDGAERLRRALDQITEVERPRLTALPASDETRRQLQLLEQRAAVLHQSLQSAVVVPPPEVKDGQVKFGALVTVRDRAGIETQYRIVGSEEADVDQGWISSQSPLARALLKARVGERVRFRVPAGEEELSILSVSYRPSAE